MCVSTEDTLAPYMLSRDREHSFLSDLRASFQLSLFLCNDPLV